MPPLATADEYLILEFIAGNRRIPNNLVQSLRDSPRFSSASRRYSQRLRQTLVLRTLDAALCPEGASSSSSLLLHNARMVLAHAETAAAYLPHQIPFTANEENDEARAAAAVADLKRLIDLEWDNLPPFKLKLAADEDGAHHTWANEENDEARAEASAEVAGLTRFLDLEWDNHPPSTLELAADKDAAHHTWAAADHTNVEESTERENLAKLAQDGSASRQPILTEVDDEDSSNESNEEADHGRGMAGHQNASVKGATDKSVPAFTKCSPMEGNPNAIIDELDSFDDGQPVRKSTERENLAKLVQDGSASRQPILTEVDDEANSSNESNEQADHGQGMAGHQNASVKGATDKSVPAFKNCSPMVGNPNASTDEGRSDDGQPVRKRKSHPSERESYPSPTCAPPKIRKKWSEIEETTLLEGVEKYGRGNWKAMKRAYPDVFKERSEVDLKDKVRNLERRDRKSA